jgi:hypothetical protein
MGTSASGTGNINIEGVNYLLTWATDATTSFTNFKTLYSTALAARGIVLSGTTTLIVTAGYEGQPMATVTWTNLSGTTACSVAATTANTKPAALSAGESLTILQGLYEGSDQVMKGVPDAEKVFLVSRLVYENYMAYLETLSTVTANTKLENGNPILMYRGMPVLPMDWTFYGSNDFPHAAGDLPYSPHRAIFTQNSNLVLGLDTMSQYNETDMWYDKNTEENRFRAKLVMGVQFVHNKLMTVYY